MSFKTCPCGLVGIFEHNYAAVINADIEQIVCNFSNIVHGCFLYSPFTFLVRFYT